MTSASNPELPDHPVWAAWKKLVALFPGWSLIPESFVTPGAWTMTGVDFVSGLRRNRSTRKAFEATQDLPSDIFAGLCDLAALNEARQAQVLRMVIIGYLTIPLSVIAVLAEIAGDDLSAFVRTHALSLIGAAAVLTLGPIGYFISHWRARQIVSVLRLIQIERSDTPRISVSASAEP